ncbi:hypothetical protein AWH69_14410 [Janibacter melonis]|uniref:Peptidase S1 domain-containing protein n=1 Tax=Janibacter melonis TaxID=262209 RepID=A0A176QA12_9MICO|nr:trypsin-like serine protease [Janibacter melonis]OAB86515.1 hypothetical protein AWH69_14410 [Janibacter melonis]
MKRSTIVAAAGAVTLLAASPAAAINTYNAQPAPERTEVGAYLALWDTTGDGVPDRFDWRCSGTMVDDDTFLTAAHCTDGSPAGTRTFVSLEEDVQSLLDEHADLTPSAQADLFLANGWVVEGDPHQDARYPGPASDTADLAVVDFAGRDVTPADVWDFTPATLPTAGQLDRVGGTTLARAPWTVVGYGTAEAQNGPGGHTHPGGGVRLKASEGFNALTKSWVRLSINESKGYGGACYGDSGGPNFVTVDGQQVLGGTTITGDVPCKATNVVYRLDTAPARAFLTPFVTLR